MLRMTLNDVELGQDLAPRPLLVAAIHQTLHGNRIGVRAPHPDLGHAETRIHSHPLVE
jgi:hypothetical protein